MKVKGKVEMRDVQTSRLMRERILGAILLVVLNLVATVTYAQQLPPGRIAYTKYPLGGIDYKELWLISSDGTKKQLLPQIQLGGFPGFASVASIGVPAWSKDGSLIAANAILSSSLPGDLDPLQQLIWQRLTLATPTNVLVVFDPSKNQGNAVFNLDTNTGTATGLVSSQWINAAFSPDRQRLAYAVQELNFVEYGVININGKGKVPLFSVNLTENALGLGIDWSPRLDQVGNGGNLLVVSYPQHFSDPTCSNMPRSVAALYLTDSQGKVIRQLTRPPQLQQACSLFVANPLLLLNPLYLRFSQRLVARVFTRWHGSGVCPFRQRLDEQCKTILYYRR